MLKNIYILFREFEKFNEYMLRYVVLSDFAVPVSLDCSSAALTCCLALFR